MANAKSKPFKGPNSSAVEALIARRTKPKRGAKEDTKGGVDPNEPDADDKVKGRKGK